MDIIGAYLCAVWEFEKQNIFLDLLSKKLVDLNSQQQAMFWYISALQRFHRHSSPLIDLQKSEKCYDGHVNSLLLLLQYCPNKKAELLEKAKNNVLCVLSKEEALLKSPIDLIEPNQYIAKEITGTIISDSRFKELFIVQKD